MTRKAFIGLSTPLGYDYHNSATKTKADQSSSPNPILDSPFGLMLLFDELIFLSKSLCPENMRDLSFVKFLDEDNIINGVSKEDIEFVLEQSRNAHYTYASNSSWNQLLNDAGIFEKMGVDNHTHGLKIGNYIGAANSDICHLAIDTLFLSKLEDKNIELVTNSHLSSLTSNNYKQNTQQIKLTELLVIDNISNYLTQKGPYHPVIDEVRENEYLKNFRKWIIEQNGSASLHEVAEMKQEVEHALQEAQENLFLKHLDPKRHFTTIGKACLGDAIGLIYPLAGITQACLDIGTDIINPSAQKWQGFIISAKQQIRNYSA